MVPDTSRWAMGPLITRAIAHVTSGSWMARAMTSAASVLRRRAYGRV